VFLFPFAAPSTAGFVGIGPKGRGMDAVRQQEGRKPSLLTPRQNRGAQGRSGNRAAFSLDTFFWRRKRKCLAVGCENPIKTIRRDSDSA